MWNNSSMWKMENEEEETEEKNMETEIEYPENVQKLHKNYEKFDEIRTQYEESKQEMKDSVFDEDERRNIEKRIRKKKNTREYTDFVEAISEFEKVHSSKFKQEALDLFSKVFEGCRSTNHEICKIPEPGRKWKVTLGKKGFARRDNVQAQDLRFSDMKMILKHSDTIVKKIEKTNLDEQADKLRLFAKHFPDDIDSVTQKTFPMYKVKGTVVIKPAHSTWETVGYIKPELRRYRSNQISFRMQRDDDEHTQITTVKFEARATREQTMAAYAQLEPEFDDMIEELKNECKKQTAETRSKLDELKDEFSKYILMDKL